MSRFNSDNIREGDIVLIDESLAYQYHTRKYEALVLWNGVNDQPLVTRLDKYCPYWTTYDQIAEIKGHIDLGKKLCQSKPKEIDF